MYLFLFCSIKIAKINILCIRPPVYIDMINIFFQDIQYFYTDADFSCFRNMYGTFVIFLLLAH